MVASEYVIRVPRVDSGEEDNIVFLYISYTTSNPINLRLLATEGEKAYAARGQLLHYLLRETKTDD